MKAPIQSIKGLFGRDNVIFDNASLVTFLLMNALKVEEWNIMMDVNICGVLKALRQVC